VPSATDRFLEGMVRYYADRAPLYDRSMGYDRPEAIAAHARIVEFLIAQLRGKDVLEVAAGPGFWTSLLAPHCRTIVATDVNAATQAEARKKLGAAGNVTLQLADAYDLTNVRPTNTGAFAVDWWSHVPKSKLPVFLDALHGRVAAGARVVMVDQLDTRDHPDLSVRRDHEGNKIEVRRLPGDRSYEIIKNYPTEVELVASVGERGQDPSYLHDLPASRWAFAYTVRRAPL
jgi:SAM-dependent methyltransferase